MSEASHDAHKPIVLTAVAAFLAIPLQPLIGVDLIYDIAAILFVGSKWMNYYSALRQVTSNEAGPANDRSGVRSYNLGVERFNAKDYPAALRHFRAAADKGDTDALICINDIGVRYARGDTVKKNWPEAVRVYKIAAGYGEPTAQGNLGGAYRHGFGVPVDLAASRRWYSLAAEQGLASAIEALAELGPEQQSRTKPDTPGDGRMTRAAALEILDLKEGATPAVIKARYTALMQHVHPDKGGSTFFAKQLNEAREVLLR